MSAKKGGLGRGFNAIMIDNTVEQEGGTVTLKLTEIEPNRGQPRKEFNDESLHELCDSIRQHGVLQPLLVRPIADGGYQLVAGERRWRASRMAGLMEVPVIVKELSDQEVMTIALIENIQREELSPLEEAQGYKFLMQEYSLTQEEVSNAVGKSRSAVANAIRLLALPQEILDYVTKGKLSAGHARTILAIKDEKKQLDIAEYAVKNEISVRHLEKLVAQANKEDNVVKTKEKSERRPVYFEEVELALKEHLGRKVKIDGKKGKGVLQIEFYNKDDLRDLAYRLGRE